MRNIVIDTHTLVWFLSNDEKLSKKAERTISNSSTILIIPTIVLVEARYLFEKHRIKISIEHILKVVEKDKRCRVFPLDIEVIEYIPEGLNIHDGIIVGTALLFKDTIDRQVAVATKDETIVNSNLVETIW